MMKSNELLASRDDDFSLDHGGEGGFGVGLKKGPWTAGEDSILTEYVKKYGEGNWNAVQKNSDLARCGKSCRLRWANHLRPNLKKGSFSPQEEHLILELHAKLGNKWARMASQLPGRTDNEIKNYWNTRVKRCQRAGLPLYPQDIKSSTSSFQLHYQKKPSLSQQFSSSQQQKPNFISPPSLFNHTTTISTAPFLPSQFHDLGRFRVNNNIGFTLPFDSPYFFSQNHLNQLQSASTLQYNLANYDLNPPQILQTPFEPDGLVDSGSTFSMKMELPSSQLPQETAINADNSGSAANYSNLSQSNSGLLDALLQQPQTMAGTEYTKQEEKGGLDQLVEDAPALDSIFNLNASNPPLGSASQFSFGTKTKGKPKEETISSVDDNDFSSFLDIIPPPMSLDEWGYSDSGEISNGQSSGVTEDDIDLEMKQLVSSLPDNWSLDTWNNMPGIC